MSKTILVIVVIIITLGVGTYMFSQNTSKSDPTMMKLDITEDKMGDFSYVEYSKSALDNAVNKRRVLFFYASWCSTCKPADVDLKANSNKIPTDVAVIRVNYNDKETEQEEKDLAKKYGVTYQHTFIQIDGQGNEVVKWNGGQTKELLMNIK